MFGIFKKESAPPSPLKADSRQRVDIAFRQLTDTFGKEGILNRKVLIPHHSDFPIRYNGDPQTATDTLAILATQMEIPIDDIELNIYDDTINALSTGAPGGVKIFLGAEPDPEPRVQTTTYTRTAAGKYPVTIERSKLENPELLVAKLARELAGIKLSDLMYNSSEPNEPTEPLPDLTTLLFGLGIFNANASFTTKNLQQTDRLNQMEWGYALALFARLRNEKKPAWADHLVKNIKSDFLKSQQYLAHPSTHL
jgi:hypothetical protein